jgi:hypothetical protein
MEMLEQSGEPRVVVCRNPVAQRFFRPADTHEHRRADGHAERAQQSGHSSSCASHSS